MPNTFTTGKYVGIIGDFSKYWIVDSLTLRVQRLETGPESHDLEVELRQ